MWAPCMFFIHHYAVLNALKASTFSFKQFKGTEALDKEVVFHVSSTVYVLQPKMHGLQIKVRTGIASVQP